MNMITAGRLSVLVLGLGVSLPGFALAQGTPPAATQAPAALANPARRTQHLTQEQMMQQVETHLAGLRAQLGITPAQEPQWQEFAKVQRDNAVAMRQRFAQRGTLLGQMSAADNMMDYAQISEQLAQERMRLAVAFRGLYDTMSPEQKQRADVIFRTPRQQHQRRAAARPG